MTENILTPQQPVLLVQTPGEKNRFVALTRFPFIIGGLDNPEAQLQLPRLQNQQFVIKRRDKMYIAEVAIQGAEAAINGEYFRNAPLKSGDVLTTLGVELTFYEEYAEFDSNTALNGFQQSPTTRIKGLSGNDQALSTDNVAEIASGSHASLDAATSQKVLSCMRQLIQADSAGSYCQLLLRCIDAFGTPSSRAALFSVPESLDNLTLITTKQSAQKSSLTLSQSGMKQVIQQRKSLLLQAKSDAKPNSLTRFIAPLLSGKDVLAILHVEWDHLIPLAPQLDGLSQLLKLGAGTYESLLLKDAMDQNLLNTVSVIVEAVDAKDTYTRGHSERVSKYSMAAAEVLGLSRDVKKYLLISSICHDIGKIGISDAVLKKPSMLSAEEYEEIKTHPSIGGKIIERLPNAKKIISGVVYHHEKWDGTGYPDGLIGEEIPFFARIIAIADAYDAMVSGRSYSGFMQGEDAMSRFREIAELFDKDILQAFFKAYDDGRLSVRTNTLIRA